jgi:hypothetical protein
MKIQDAKLEYSAASFSPMVTSLREIGNKAVQIFHGLTQKAQCPLCWGVQEQNSSPTSEHQKQLFTVLTDSTHDIILPFWYTIISILLGS